VSGFHEITAEEIVFESRFKFVGAMVGAVRAITESVLFEE